MTDWTPCEEPSPRRNGLFPPRAGLATAGDVLWIADALRAEGCQVIETAGWQDRGHGDMGDIRGVLTHHTGGGGPNDWVIVRDGRPDLAGPLAQLTLERDGSFRVIAAGVCWHAGPADSQAIANRVRCGTQDGNYHLVGIEGVSNGTTWTDAQRREYPKGVVAILRATGLGADRMLGHKEWAPSRKPDPGNTDMKAFRAEVDRILVAGRKPRWTGDQYMSQGTLPACELDKDDNPIPRRAYFCATTGDASGLTNRTWFALATGWDDAECHVWFIGTHETSEGTGVAPNYLLDFSAVLPKSCRRWWQAPNKTDQIAVEYRSKNIVGWEIEKEPKP
jgi:hypothetical protein